MILIFQLFIKNPYPCDTMNMGSVIMGDIIELLLDIILAIADHKSKKPTQKELKDSITDKF